MQLSQTPLHISVANNKVEIVKYLLDWKGPGEIELEAKNAVCKSNLKLKSLWFENKYKVIQIVSYYVVLFCFTFQYGETPLHLAAQSGNNEVARMLLSLHANIEAKTNVRV